MTSNHTSSMKRLLDLMQTHSAMAPSKDGQFSRLLEIMQSSSDLPGQVEFLAPAMASHSDAGIFQRQ